MEVHERTIKRADSLLIGQKHDQLLAISTTCIADESICYVISPTKEYILGLSGPIVARRSRRVRTVWLPARMEELEELPQMPVLSLSRQTGVYNYHTSTQFRNEKYRISRAAIEIAPVPVEQEHTAFPRFGPRKSRATRKRRGRDADAKRRTCSCEVQKEAQECFQSWCG